VLCSLDSLLGESVFVVLFTAELLIELIFELKEAEKGGIDVREVFLEITFVAKAVPFMFPPL